MNQPAISVIITVYNQEKYIGKCIRSVIGQSFEDFEIILVNDGSTDKSLMICQKYAQKDHRIVIINQPNSGIIQARKEGILHAQGEFVFFVDGDDYITYHALHELISLAKEYELDMVVGNHRRVCDNWSFISKNGLPYKKNNMQISNNELIMTWLGLGMYGKHSEGGVYLWGQLIRRSCVMTALREDGEHLFPSTRRCMEDLMFHLAVAPYIDSCWLSNLIVYYYRTGGCTMHYCPYIKKGGDYYDFRYEMCNSYGLQSLLPYVLAHYRMSLLADVAGQIHYGIANIEEIREFVSTELKNRKIAIWSKDTHYDELNVDDIISCAIMQNKNNHLQFLKNKLIMIYQKIVDQICALSE